MAAPISSNSSNRNSPICRVLELYSGIGGMHYALKESGLCFDVVQAVDVNTNANKIYRFNCPDTCVSSRGIEGLTVKELDKLDIDMILMSPPCQPFTRVGKKQDANDARTRSFLHLLELIPRLKKCPSYILLENVSGFEVSETRNRLIETLNKCQYVYQEMLLTPIQFGIPNSRLRYYMIAKQSPPDFIFERTPTVMTKLPEIAEEWMKYKRLAESVQHQCVCGGHIGEESTHFIDKESASVSDGQNICASQTVSQHTSVSDRLGIYNRGCNNLSDTQSDSAIRSDNQSGANVDSESEKKHHHAAGVDSMAIDTIQAQNESSQNHTCAKRLKTDNGKKYDDCIDKKETQTRHTTQSTAECESAISHNKQSAKDYCLNQFGFNMRQEETQENLAPCLKLKHFMENTEDREKFEPYFLTDSMLRNFVVMDIINPCCRKSTCFTKRYGNFVNGAGSIIQMARDIKVIEQASALKDMAVKNRDQEEWSESEHAIIRSLQLRYFTPREIANILCFPETFDFPSDLTNRQLYMLLGNSLNVHVVSILIRLMAAEDSV